VFHGQTDRIWYVCKAYILLGKTTGPLVHVGKWSMINSRRFCKIHFFRLKITIYAANLDFFPQTQYLHVDGSIRVPSMTGNAKCNHEIHVKFAAIQ